MIGRYSDLSLYREIFKSKDFFRVLGGVVLIPIALLVGREWEIASPILLIASLAINGFPIVKEAFLGLIKKQVNVDELVSIALVACLINGNYLEGAVVAAIMVAGALIEEGVSDSARREIERMIELSPKEAVVEREGEEITLPLSQVQEGDMVVVRPGELIPLDGIVITGSAWVDESSLTGESLPVTKKPGSPLAAGTMNKDGFLKLQVTRTGEDSTINRVISLVRDAENGEIESDRIVDRFARWFTPTILAIAVLTYLITKDLERATTVLIVGCPCSFLLTGPVTTVAAIGRAARSGILVKGGRYLEKTAAASSFYFDKTGTLTEGEPRLVKIEPTGEWTEEDLIRMAAAVEQGSQHPLARALTDYAREKGWDREEARDIRNFPGHGIEGIWREKKVALSSSVEKDNRGYTSVLLKVDGEKAGLIHLHDDPREEAAPALENLRKMGVDELVLISGDRPEAVEQVAQAVGATAYYGRLKPEDKLAHIRKRGGEDLVYVGDGINDAPALKAAGAGIAMGLGGTDIALETADIILLNDRLDNLPFLVKLSRRMTRTIKAGLIISLTINALSLLLAFEGILTPIWGAVSHNFGSLLVVTLGASLAMMDESC
ncbi:MAG: cation-translocating P-type ATPase [Spirochaetales bacterium]|nr:cation-translocating P-type ATPase [Spirochaetales bacterium]